MPMCSRPEPERTGKILRRERLFANELPHLRGVWVGPFEHGRGDEVPVVVLGEYVEQEFAILLRLFEAFRGNFVHANGLAEVVGVEELGLHLDEIDHAAKRRAAIGLAARADGNDDRHGPAGIVGIGGLDGVGRA